MKLAYSLLARYALLAGLWLLACGARAQLMTCPYPISVTATNVTATTATIGWSYISGPTNLSSCGISARYSYPGGPTLSANPSAPVYLTNLVPGQTYTFIISRSCSGGTFPHGVPCQVVKTTSTTFTTLAATPSPLQLTGISPASGPVGTLVTLTGANLNLAATVSFNGTVVAAASFVSQSATTLKVRVPAGATTGPATVAPASGAGVSLPFIVTSGTAGPLVVSTGSLAAPAPVAAGAYASLTVTGTGVARLAGPVEVSGAVTVQAGGTLLTNCQLLTGTGSFTLAAGATLGICDPAGLSSTPGTGAVQLSGARSFSPDASYVYSGTQPQVTGNALPAQVRSLTTTNAADLTLSQGLSVRQVLAVADAGNLLTNGQPLTLLSDATGSALVVNGGAGSVIGDATVQRYVDPSRNPGSGYRHYSAPIADATVASLTTSGFTPTVNPAYNTSATPATVRPFPTVFGYDAARLSSTSNNLPAFDKGWFSPAALTDLLAPGQGYTVQVGAAERVAFTGTLNNDSLRVELPGNPAAGWQLLGNPYPAPLDYALVAAADRTGLDPALYVAQSTGPYQGGYRTVNNGISTTGETGLLATAQGFFVHVPAGQASAHLTFRNAQRVADYATAQQVAFQRPAADSRPLVRLALQGAGLTDHWVTYAETGASAAYEPAFDALKLLNSTGLNLNSAPDLHLGSPGGGSGELLAIDGQAAFTAATTLPLTLGVPAAGTYALTAATIANLPAGLAPYLTDAQTGQTTLLTGTNSYSFSVSAPQAAGLLAGRFTLRFSPPAALAAAATLPAGAVVVYPNPARGGFAVELPGVVGAAQVQAELLNVLGQVVRRQMAPLPAGGTTLTVAVPGLAAGVYALRLTAGPATLTRRVVLE